MRAYGAAISFYRSSNKERDNEKAPDRQYRNPEAIRCTSEAVAIRERQEFKAGTKLSHASDSREREMTAREEMR